MRVEVRDEKLSESGAELVVAGLYEDGAAPAEIAAAPGAAGAKGAFKTLTAVYPESGPRALLVGLGKREEIDAERLRVAAALAAKEAGRLEVGSLAWVLPDFEDDDAAAEALVTGTVLGAYRFDDFRGSGPPWETAARPPMPLARISLGPSTSTVTASSAAAICSARAARKLGVAKLAGVFCRSRARFWALEKTRPASAAAATASGASSVSRSSPAGFCSLPLPLPRKSSKR
jgi:leucyl aminopeptidase